MPGVLPPPLNLLLCWPGSELIPLTLPYPQRGAVFQLAGRPLFNDDWVPLDRLGGLQVLIQDPAGGRNFWLDGELLRATEPVGEPLRQTFRTRLPPLEQGRLELSLLAWRTGSPRCWPAAGIWRRKCDCWSRPGKASSSHLRIAQFNAVIEPDGRPASCGSAPIP